MDGRQGRAGAEEFPWLEAVDDEDEAPRLSARKMLAALALMIGAAALVAVTLFVMGRTGPGAMGNGPPELILAEAGPYKVKPDEPGGLDVAGDSGTAFATGAGEETDAELDLDAVPEDPVTRPVPVQDAPPKTLPANETRVPVDAPVPTPAPSGPAGSTVQLGYFPSAVAANSAWETLSGRFSVVAGAGKIVVPYQNGFRLRAALGSSADATRACQLLKIAGEACFVVR